MRLFGKQRYHHRRAAEERARAEAAVNSDAKDVHVRLARYHSRIAQDPDFVPFEKASRHAQPSSYWAAAHLSNKVGTEEEDAIASSNADKSSELTRPIPEALGLRNGPGVRQLLTDLFPTVDDENVSWPKREP
jgi:hypothetical protein